MADLDHIRSGKFAINVIRAAKFNNETSLIISWIIDRFMLSIDEKREIHGVNMFSYSFRVSNVPIDNIRAIFHSKWIRNYMSNMILNIEDGFNPIVKCTVRAHKYYILGFIPGFHPRLNNKSPILAFSRSPLFDRQLLRVLRRVSGD